MTGINLAKAVMLAIEALPGSIDHWMTRIGRKDAEYVAMVDHVVWWVNEFTRTHGVIYERAEIERELDAVCAIRKGL